jgi:hypothetical protein
MQNNNAEKFQAPSFARQHSPSSRDLLRLGVVLSEVLEENNNKQQTPNRETTTTVL